MAEPALDEDVEDEADPPESEESESDESEEAITDEQIVQTDIAETGTDPDGFFDGVEADAEGATGSQGMFEGFDTSDEEDDDEPPEVADTRSTGLAKDINRGCSRLAVIGLDDEWETQDGTVQKKEDLRKEFQETFEAFRLGHYSERVIEEYLLIDKDDIHPVWGLVGAMLICAAVVVYRRPDGDQIIESGKTRLGDFDLSDLRSDD